MMTKQVQSAAGAAFAGYASENGSFLAKARGFVTGALQRLNDENDTRQAIWEIQQLDDRALRDIGIKRCDIEAHVRGRR